jgi:hypothetical protein
MPQSALVGGPGVEASWRLAQGSLLLGFGNGWGNSDGRRLGYLILDGEDVGEVAVIAGGPNVLAGLGLD